MSVINKIYIIQIREIVIVICCFVIQVWYLKGWNMVKYFFIVIRMIVIVDRFVKMKLVDVYMIKVM